MISLTDEENKSYKNQKVCYICRKRFNTDNDNGILFNGVAPNKNIIKSEVIVTTQDNIEGLLLVFVTEDTKH